MDRNDTHESPEETPRPRRKRSAGVARRDLVDGLAILAALTSEAAAGAASAQGSASTLSDTPTRTRAKAAESPFAEVVQKALANPAYAAQLRAMAIQVRQGDRTAAAQLMSTFQMTPTALKSVNAQLKVNPNILLSTGLCLSIGVTLTLLFSCIPGACKEAR